VCVECDTEDFGFFVKRDRSIVDGDLWLNF
jgi:hypothetical protein